MLPALPQPKHISSGGLWGGGDYVMGGLRGHGVGEFASAATQQRPELEMAATYGQDPQ